MTLRFYRTALATLVTISAALYMQTGAYAFANLADMKSGAEFIIDVKQPKCSASTVEDYEGTDMSGVTPKCEAVFDACVNESLACSVRLQKCKEFDKMDRDGSCYKKKS